MNKESAVIETIEFIYISKPHSWKKMTITGLFMGWTDPVTNNWFPLKKITWNEGKYYTVYLQGMLSAMQVSEAHRTTVKAGLAKLDRVAISNDIHVSFKVRMPVNRPFTAGV